MTTHWTNVLLAGAFVGGILAVVPAATAQSTIGNDPFLTGATPANGEYSVGSLTGQNPTVSGFSGAWSGGGGNVSSSSLSYSNPNYAAPSGGSIVTAAANRFYRGMDATLSSDLSTSANGIVYMSFLAKFAGGTGGWGYAALELGTGALDTTKALAIGIDSGVSGNFMYQLDNGAKVSLGTARDANTHLFLVEFNLSSSASSDSVTMWVDPTLGGVGDPSGGTTVSGFNLFDINDLRIGSGAANNSFDEIRFGTTLSSVIAVPEPASLSLLGIGALGILAFRRKKSWF